MVEMCFWLMLAGGAFSTLLIVAMVMLELLEWVLHTFFGRELFVDVEDFEV